MPVFLAFFVDTCQMNALTDTFYRYLTSLLTHVLITTSCVLLVKKYQAWKGNSTHFRQWKRCSWNNRNFMKWKIAHPMWDSNQRPDCSKLQSVSPHPRASCPGFIIGTPPTKSLWTVLPAVDSALALRLFQQVAVRKPLYINQPNKFCFKGDILYC